jgi:hypothetical protein
LLWTWSGGRPSLKDAAIRLFQQPDPVPCGSLLQRVRSLNMISKNDIIEKAYECGFGHMGFTTADSFDSQRELLQERQKEYEWAFKLGLDLIAGTDPKRIFPDAKTIIVLMEVYFKEAFPSSMESYFGRCYLDDDRVTMDGLANEYIPDLLRAFRNNDDERVLGMIAWAMGRMGGSKAKKALNDILPGSDGLVREEILFALEKS